MNLVYVCVFHQQSYIRLLRLLIDSISVRSKIRKETTDILIMTSPDYLDLIQQELSGYALSLHYSTLDLHTKFEAGCARLNIFRYENIHKYDKILYVDTDVLINSDINVLFDIEISPDKVYALEEGTLGHSFWGSQFFDFTKYSRTQPAFTSGILFFRNSDSIKSLFDSIHSHIIEYVYTNKNRIPICLDQPFIVYNAVTQDKYDNQLLKSYVENNPSGVSPEKIIYHFPGTPGHYVSKYKKMTEFWDKMMDKTAVKTVNIYEDLWTCSDEMRDDIADFFRDKTHFRIAEIGSHKGYSTKILSRLFSTVYAVDNSLEWTAFNKNYNQDRTNIEYVMLDIYKDSWEILPGDIEVSFIDAGHTYEQCKSDIINSIKTFRCLQYIIFDDYGVWPGVKKAVDEMIEKNMLQFERFIGLTNVPGPNGVVHNTHEGILCSVVKVL